MKDNIFVMMQFHVIIHEMETESTCITNVWLVAN